MDKAVCGCFLVVLVLLFAPTLGTQRPGTVQGTGSAALALARFSGWWGNRPEAPGGRAQQEAKFPGLITVLRSSRTRPPSSACSWAGLQAGCRLRVFASTCRTPLLPWAHVAGLTVQD